MIDDPSAVPEEFPKLEDQEKERSRLFSLLEEIIKWENTMDKGLFKLAREEFKKSWIRCCDDNVSHPEAKTLLEKILCQIFMILLQEVELYQLKLKDLVSNHMHLISIQ